MRVEPVRRCSGFGDEGALCRKGNLSSIVLDTVLPEILRFL